MATDKCNIYHSRLEYARSLKPKLRLELVQIPVQGLREQNKNMPMVHHNNLWFNFIKIGMKYAITAKTKHCACSQVYKVLI